jgi:hypothetical protein
MDDEFDVEGDASALSAQILASLAQAGLRTSRTEAGIHVQAGSDFLFRLLGTPLGSNQLPVGIDVQVISAGDNIQVSASAYDRLGWYFNKSSFGGRT